MNLSSNTLNSISSNSLNSISPNPPINPIPPPRNLMTHIYPRSYTNFYKYVLVGPSSAGKSSLLRRFVDNQYQDGYVATIGVDFRFSSLQHPPHYIKLQLWDTAGQQRFRTITRSYYHGANIIFLVCDGQRGDSMRDIQEYWIGEVRKNWGDGKMYCLINKCDWICKKQTGRMVNEQLQDKQEQYQQQQQEAISQQLHEFISYLTNYCIPYYLVSAKTGHKVAQVIRKITLQLVKQQEKNKNNKIKTNMVGNNNSYSNNSYSNSNSNNYNSNNKLMNRFALLQNSRTNNNSSWRNKCCPK